MQKNQSTIRYRIRTKKISLREHFLPWGLLGILLVLLPLIYALAWYAKNEIQATVLSEVKKELASQSFEWVDVSVDGQTIMLTGVASKQQADQAISLAKNVKNPAWFGRFSVPSTVDSRFSEPPETVVKSAVTPISPVAKTNNPATNTIEPVPIENKPNWGKLTARLESGVLTLDGIVSSETEKNELLDVANKKLDPPRLTRVIDNLAVSKRSLTPASAALAQRASSLIANCTSGQSISNQGLFSIQCQAKRDQVANLESLAKAPLQGAKFGRIRISGSDDCNNEFAQILDGKSIRFSIASANLKSSSAPLLDKIAGLVKSCAGSIRVEGHTDKTGNAESNTQLSKARATAVVEALVELGVKRERLKPIGFGSSKPRAEGDTPVAHALNRRIEIHVSQ